LFTTVTWGRGLEPQRFLQFPRDFLRSKEGTPMKSHLPLLITLPIAFVGVRAIAQSWSSWTDPFPPHTIAGNLHYVGSRDLASYLITTSEGHILINSSLEESVPLIRASVEKLGFKFTDVKVLLISHAHSDHCAGSAEIRS
jgi:metallo-beta-lactamase class B